MPAASKRDRPGRRILAGPRQPRVHAVDPERRAVVVLRAERPFLVRVLRRHIEPALVAVHRVASHVRGGAALPLDHVERVRNAAEVPGVFLVLEGVRRDIVGRALVVAPADRVRVVRVAEVRAWTHLQVLHVEAGEVRHRAAAVLVADRLVGVPVARAERAAVVRRDMAEAVPADGEFFRAVGLDAASARGHDELAVDPEEHPVVALALERPQTSLAFLDVELADGKRRRVVHVAERTVARRIILEEEGLVMRDRAARGAAGHPVEAIGDAGALGWL